MKVILVGAGGTAKELIRRLGEAWDVTVVDVDPEQLKRVLEVREAEVVEGDGSSRLVLERAGINQADGVIATTNDDAANLEVCRLAKEANVFRIAAVANDPDQVPNFRSLGVAAHAPSQLAARWLELDLEPRRIASMAFAKGQAEAIELEVAGDSPVIDKALQDIPSPNWLVSAILRDGRLIIPHGSTVIREGDQVTVVGSAASFAEIVRTFTAGEARFPLDFGRRTVTVLDSEKDLDSVFAEALHFVRNSMSDELVVLHRGSEDGDASPGLLEQAKGRAEGLSVSFRPLQGRLPDAFARVAADGNVGVFVIPAATRSGFLARLRRPPEVRLADKLGIPVLAARGSNPYSRILVPARSTSAGKAAARAAIDLARVSKSDLTALAVVDPNFISQGGAEEARMAAGSLKQEAAVQGISVTRRIRRGNPVRVFLDFETDLLIAGLGDRAAGVGVRLIDHLVRRAASSVLIVPVARR